MNSSTRRPVVVVTGAGSGIGLAISHLLATEGYDVGVVDVDLAAAQRVATDIEHLGAGAVAFECDVRIAEQVAAAIDGVVAHFGHLDAAVNNAGMSVPVTDIVGLDESDWDRVIDIDLKGVWLSMKYEIPHLLEAGGAIVNMASIFGLAGSVGTSPAYVAAKHGVVGLTKAAALHYATRGIRINAVCPATIDTPGVSAKIAADPVRLSRRTLESWQPMDRMGSPDEVAKATAWLLGEGSSFTTGTTVTVDGGFTAR